MKKLLFTAVIGIAAVGGAFATKSTKMMATGEFYTEDQTGQPDIICSAGPQLCSAYYGESVYDKPADDNTRQLVDLTQYEHPVD